MEIERMGPEGWERVRAVRLRALRDAPDAFARTFSEEEVHPPEFWRKRLASPDAATFLATIGNADVGIVAGAPFLERDGAAGLFGMWVEPTAASPTQVATRLIRR